MSTPLYNHFTQSQSTSSLGASSASISTSIYNASALAPSSRSTSRTPSVRYLYVPLPTQEDDPPILDIPLSPTPTESDVSVSDLHFLGDLHITTVNSHALPLSRAASVRSDVSVSNVEYLGRLHLCAVDSLTERRAENAKRGGRVRRVVRKVREMVAKVLAGKRRTGYVQGRVARG